MAANDDSRMIGAIADAVAYVGNQRGGDALLYAEAGPGWVRGSLFIDHPAFVEWVNPAAHHISELVLRLWTAAPDAKKWRALTMIVGEQIYQTELDLGESWSDEQDESDRREPIVLRFFGDRPVFYPTLGKDEESQGYANSMLFWNC